MKKIVLLAVLGLSSVSDASKIGVKAGVVGSFTLPCVKNKSGADSLAIFEAKNIEGITHDDNAQDVGKKRLLEGDDHQKEKMDASKGVGAKAFVDVELYRMDKFGVGVAAFLGTSDIKAKEAFKYGEGEFKSTGIVAGVGPSFTYELNKKTQIGAMVALKRYAGKYSVSVSKEHAEKLVADVSEKHPDVVHDSLKSIHSETHSTTGCAWMISGGVFVTHMITDRFGVIGGVEMLFPQTMKLKEGSSDVEKHVFRKNTEGLKLSAIEVSLGAFAQVL